MDWRLKCAALHLLGKVPLGRQIHGALQRYVTGRYFRTLTPASLITPNYHIVHLKRLPNDPVALEFGAGRNLLTPLLMSRAGASKVYAFDLSRLATAEQVNGIVGQLARLVPGDWPSVGSLDELPHAYNFEYRAPADARSTGLPDQSVDFICSTATNEHIPEGDLRAIMKECRRIASPDARISLIIDYHDHYGTADGKITRWNFYRFQDAEWRKYNPSNHYQNRLRHGDHERMFRELGFDVIESERIIPDWAERELAQVPVCSRFQHYSREDLLTASGRFLLGVAKEAVRPAEEAVRAA